MGAAPPTGEGVRLGERGVSPCFHDWSHCKDRERRSGNTNARARAQGTEGGLAALAGSLSSVSWQSGIAGRATERPAGETEEQKNDWPYTFARVSSSPWPSPAQHASPHWNTQPTSVTVTVTLMHLFYVTRF